MIPKLQGLFRGINCFAGMIIFYITNYVALEAQLLCHTSSSSNL